MNYNEIVEQAIQESASSPIDMLQNGSASQDTTYLRNLQDSYVRTIRDVHELNGGQSADILELGAFLGVVSIGLKKLGHSVSASDIPEFAGSPSLQELYKRNEIPFSGVNLRSYSLPYASESFDVVILCELLEHLNFNPLPVLQELNRILKPGGHIYIGMPNGASLGNRLRLLRGKSIHNPIQDYYLQLDRSQNMVVGLHWREYTLAETIEMIQGMGFEAVRSYFFQPETQVTISPLRRMVKKVLGLYPPFRGFQVVIGKKMRESTQSFWLTEANS